MSKKVLLSIIIPTHNSQSTIQNLLLSIKNSAFRRFEEIETIIIDDGSTDDTLIKIKQTILKLNYKVSLYPQKHLGPARARNFGVTKAKGNYILFLDADVVLFKKTLKRAFDLAEKRKVRTFTGIWHYRQKTKKFFPQFKALRDWTYWFVEREKNFRYYLFSTRIAGIEKKLFNQLGGFNTHYPEPTVEDIELTYRIEKKAKIKFCPDLVVKHGFEDFWPIAVKYFKRSRDWIQLYQRRLRFDPVATSKKEALKSITACLFVFFLLTGPFDSYFLLISLFTFLYFSFLEFPFWRFLMQKKGLVFLLKSIFISIVLYLIINSGAIYGLILSVFTKSSRQE